MPRDTSPRSSVYCTRRLNRTLRSVEVGVTVSRVREPVPAWISRREVPDSCLGELANSVAVFTSSKSYRLRGDEGEVDGEAVVVDECLRIRERQWMDENGRVSAVVLLQSAGNLVLRTLDDRGHDDLPGQCMEGVGWLVTGARGLEEEQEETATSASAGELSLLLFTLE